MSKDIKIIFFDVGNVLLHRVKNPLEEIAETFKLDLDHVKNSHKLATDNEKFAKLWLDMKDLKSQRKMALWSAKSFLKHAGIKETPERVEKLVYIWGHQKFALLPNVTETLNYLKPTYKLAILSNAMPSRRANELVEHNLLDYFDPIILSGELAIHKPDAGVFKHALELANVKPSQAAFIDDNPDYLKGAYKVGIKQLYQSTIARELPHYTKAIKISDLSQLKEHF